MISQSDVEIVKISKCITVDSNGIAQKWDSFFISLRDLLNLRIKKSWLIGSQGGQVPLGAPIQRWCRGPP